MDTTYPQLDKYNPTIGRFVRAYAGGNFQSETILVGPKLAGKIFDMHGVRKPLELGQALIAFPWKCNSYRIPGIGFKHCSEV